MPARKSRKAFACPVCNNATYFSAVTASLQTGGCQQNASGKWKRIPPDALLNAILKRQRAPLLLICGSCSNCVGAAPPALRACLEGARRG